ncbi:MULTISPECIES: SDR family oxidoreductase [unclassified Leifsonia]|uniref:SDR family oxidoreductase n=1 Tax=unclassified Leifsonia TaxID=2663824 RepID=UPI0006F3E9C8|nr:MULTISPECIES: SDR family oxidoreductase [unclassified Leifsonia]KQX05351.1 NAD(P)-dependent oxidoreductase [Leifsonia sp. Root1293]KRA08983.1 NAD(P)-dependent oxidoreductase [Leifsonia sp. Root60]
MTIVVTGATGHLGRLAVESLLARGVAPATIVAGGRSVEKLADLAERGVRTARIDYTDAASLAAAFDGADAVLLVSGSEVGQRVDQHRNAIDAAVAAGVGRIVYTSAPKATTSPLVLAPEHKATEELLQASGLSTTILRNGWYTENYVGTVTDAGTSGVIAASVGDGRVSSASRADYADAAAAVLTTDGHDGAVYELSGDVAWNFSELADAASELLGTPVTYQALSPEEHLAALSAAGLDEGTAGFVVALDGNIRDGLLAETSGDLARLIGRPTTPLVEGLRASIG